MAGETGKTIQRHERIEIDWKAEADRVNAALRDRIEDVARALQPEKTAVKPTRTATQMRWDGLVVDVAGLAKGRVTHFSIREKGFSPIGYICAVQGCDKRGAYAWARDFLGWGDPLKESAEARAKRKAEWKAKEAERAAMRAKAEAKAEAEAAEKSAWATRQWDEAGHVVNTPAEKYLRRRGLTDWPDDWPDQAVRYHKSFRGAATIPEKYSGPAILFPVTDTRGRVVAVQAVRLTRDGRKDRAQKIVKQSLGPIGEGLLRLPGTGDLHMAEGPETALSIWQATGAPVIATLGQITARRIEAAPVPAGRALVICGDAADEGTPTAANLSDAVMAARARGVLVKLAVPDGPSGTDWNDILQRDGVAAVSKAIEAAPWTLPEGWTPAFYPAPCGTVEAARKATARAFRRWGDAVLAGNPENLPPPVLVKVPTGVGKSYAARQEAVRLARETRRTWPGKPDLRPAVVIAVPTHRLAEEYKMTLRALAPDVVSDVYRGRSAVDPASESRMCARHKAAKDLARVGGDVEKHLCGDVKGNLKGDPNAGPVCPFYKTCLYQAQRKKTAEIWVTTHATLFNKPPAVIATKDRRPVAVIVDESPVGSIWGGFSGAETDEKGAKKSRQATQLSLDMVAAPLTKTHRDDSQTADLVAWASPLANALRAIPARSGQGSGVIRIADLIAAGVTAEAMHDAAKLITRFLWDDKVRPDHDAEKIAAEVDRITPRNRAILTRWRLFRMVAEAIDEGRDTLPGCRREAPLMDGLTVETVRLRWRSDVHPSWAAPTLICDATADPLILRHIWPDLGDALTIDAAMPDSVRVRQITDYAFGEEAFNVESTRPKKASLAKSTLLRVRHYIEARAAEFLPGRVLVVAQKSVRERLEAAGLPQNVETAHFKALAGLDHWREVRGVIVIGRTQPTHGDLEIMSEVLARRPGRAVPGTYMPRRPASLNIRGIGSGPPVFARSARGPGMFGAIHHPDELTEALRWQVCEAELMQAIGRGRAVNRMNESPLSIDILTNVPLPIAVQEAGTMAEFMPSPIEVMAIRGILPADMSARGAKALIGAVMSDLFARAQSPCKAAKDAVRLRPQDWTLTGEFVAYRRRREGDLFTRESNATVRPPDCRYAVEVKLSARTPAEAEALLSRIMPGAELVDFTPAPSTKDAERRPVRPSVVVPKPGNAMTPPIGRFAHVVNRITIGSAITRLDAKTFGNLAEPPPAPPGVKVLLLGGSHAGGMGARLLQTGCKFYAPSVSSLSHYRIERSQRIADP